MNRAVPKIAAALFLVAAIFVFIIHHQRNLAVEKASESASAEIMNAIQTDQIAREQAAPVQVSKYSKQDLEKARVLDEIFHARNDNDPRLDTDFRDLSESAKALMREKYRSLSVEKRNERGTIVFLLGRNLANETDFGFLKEVLSESPCLSLGDCSKDPAPSSGRDLHEEIGTEVTLAYPQIIALEMIQRYLSASPAPNALTQTAHQILDEATQSGIPIVARRAARGASSREAELGGLGK